jgi:hypothetical protein
MARFGSIWQELEENGVVKATLFDFFGEAFGEKKGKTGWVVVEIELEEGAKGLK